MATKKIVLISVGCLAAIAAAAGAVYGVVAARERRLARALWSSEMPKRPERNEAAAPEKDGAVRPVGKVLVHVVDTTGG